MLVYENASSSHGRRKDIFHGGPLGDFSKIFLGVKSGEICFFPLETKKTTFFGKVFKIQGGQGLPALPHLPTPMLPAL